MSHLIKRKHKTLTLNQKFEILKKLDKGATQTDLAKEYQVGRATIYDVLKNRMKIENYVKTISSGPGKRQTLRTGDYPQMEEALYAWFLQERRRHVPISGDILREKAKFFYRKIMNKDDFHASIGWLDKFKKRYGIRFLCITGEKLSSDFSAVAPFTEELNDKIKSMKLVPEQIFNADESGCNWKLLPNKTYVHKGEKCAPGRKTIKDRITFMACSNSSGTHKLDLLVIGKSKKPRAFKNVTLDKLPVKYTNQARAWMTCEVFKAWYHGDFIPSVKNYLKKNCLPQKALLLLDNAPGHPTDVDELKVETKDGFIEVMYLPANTTALIQPMDQCVIKMVKTNYKKQLLLDLVGQESDISACLTKYNIKDAIFNLAYAWRNVPANTIILSWRSLWPSHPLLPKDKTDTPEIDSLKEVMEILSTIPSNAVTNEPTEKYSLDEVRSWLEDDDKDMQLSDDDLIAEILQNDTTEEETMVDQTLPKVTVQCEEAMSAINTCIKWAEERNVDADEYLLLKKLREKVLQESFKTKTQKTIDSFFKPV